MKELSTEIINIDGVDYTLFLNRKGIIAWEKYVDQQRAKIEELQDNVRLLLVDKYKVESDNAGNKIYRIIDNYNNQYEINANIDDMLVYSMKIFEKE